ncbi:GFA family protein [Pusillimonas sp.]|uniref:GFA family protein n=1 Tax=Pusillimonas sp. TaxID=3040095 RepID=UPI0029B093C8|nr:GFA family protein [Pusillimonas sp.]MDX3894156.1 GFA family protein [Pusillimonas sp.]
MPFEGSCHCGAVRFEVDAQPPWQAISCNCSHCRRKGFLLSFFPAEQFTLLRGEEALSSYRFNTHKIEHRFCRHCGTQPFAEGANPDGSAVRAVNLRCVPSIDLDALALQRFDGAAA